MPIKWSALQVAEAMDETEKLLDQAEPFLADAKAKAGKVTGITNLPQYMLERLHRLIYTIDRSQDIRSAIARIRENIPQDAIVAERQAGKQQGLEL